MTDFVVDDQDEGWKEQAQEAPYVPVGVGSLLGATFKSGLLHPSFEPIANALAEQSSESGLSPGGLMDTSGAVPLLQQVAKPKPAVQPKDLEARYPGVTFPAPMTDEIASDYAKSKQDQAARDAVMARYPAGWGKWFLQQGAGVAATFLDPVNDAAFSVPILGEARYMNWVARAGSKAGLPGRAAVIGATGAARATAGQAILSAGRYAIDDDYTMGDAARDMLQAPLAGLVMHGGLEAARVGLGLPSDILGTRFARSEEGRQAASSADVHDAAMRTAAAQLVNGLPVEVRPVFDAARARQDLMASTALGSTVEVPGGREAQTSGEAARAAGGRAPDPQAVDRMNSAVARAAGLPDQDTIRSDHDVAAAHNYDGEADLDGRMQEAEARVAELRAGGHLGPEDELALRAADAEHAAALERPAGGEAAVPAVDEMAQHVETARSDLKAARVPVPKEPTLLDAIRAMGGIKTRDAAGKPTREGGEILNLLTDYKNPRFQKRLVNDQTGIAPDKIREALQERGWFGRTAEAGGRRGLETGSYPGDDLRDLYDLIDREVRGERLFHPESEAAALIHQRADFDEQTTRAGIASSDSPEVAAAKLAAWRMGELDAQRAWEQRAQTAGAAVRQGATVDELMADAIEAEALAAERNGTGEDYADSAEIDVLARLMELYPDATDPELSRELEIQAQLGSPENAAERSGAAGHIEREAAGAAGPAASAVGDRGLARPDYVPRIGIVAGRPFVFPDVWHERLAHYGEAFARTGTADKAVIAELWAHFKGFVEDQDQYFGASFSKPEDVTLLAHQYFDDIGEIPDTGIADQAGSVIDPDLQPAYFEHMVLGEHPLSAVPPRANAKMLAEEGKDFAGERVDLGKGKTGEQLVIPGAERSAQQVAKAREAAGRGKLKPKVEQKAPGGMFGPAKTDEPTLFEARKEPPPFPTNPATGKPIAHEPLAGALRIIEQLGKDRDIEGLKDAIDFHTDPNVPAHIRGEQSPIAEKYARALIAHLEGQTSPTLFARPKNLVVARKLPDGRIVYGKPGFLHDDLIGPGETHVTGDMAKQMGFATPEGQFLTREEASAWVKRTQPEAVPKLMWPDKLDASDYFMAHEAPLFARSKAVPELIVQHNVTGANLIHADRMGGLAVPSLAIAKAKEPATSFGEITMLGPKEMADPRGYARPRVFGADVYSPRYPTVNYKFDDAAIKRLDAILSPYWKEGERHYYETNINQPSDMRGNPAFERYAEEHFKRNGWVDYQAAGEKLIGETKPTERIFRGFTNMGNRRYIPHTLDNVVRILKSELRGGENWNYGVGSLRAHFTPQFRSVEAIRGAADRIVSREEFEKVKKDIDEQFWKVANALAPYSDRGKEFGFGDTVISAMSEAPKLGLERSLKSYGIENVPDDILRDGARFLERLRHLPTEYFEAKILRGVGISEFSHAVIPDNTPKDVRDLLAKRGVETTDYKARDEADRKRVISETAQRLSDKVMFRRGPEGWDQGQSEPVSFSGKQLSGIAFGELSPEESALKDRVDTIARQMAPTAEVKSARALTDQAGREAHGAMMNDGARRTIAWSLQSPDAEGTMRHEVVHYLRHQGLISGEEWAALEKASSDGHWIDKHGIGSRYGDLPHETQVEESIAEEFANWRRGQPVPAGLSAIWQRVQDFLGHVASTVRQMFGGDVTADDVFRRIESGEVGRRDAAGFLESDEPFFARPATPEQQAAVAKRKKLNAYQDALKRRDLETAIDQLHGTVLSVGLRAGKKLPLAQAVDALTRGISEDVAGGRLSTAAEAQSWRNHFLGTLETALDREHLMGAWRGRSETANWVRELHELNKDKTGHPGVTGSAIALKIAQAVKNAQDVARVQLNRSGAWVGDYDGYISRTAHNAVEIHKAGFQAWRDHVLARLDKDRTFADVYAAERDQMGRDEDGRTVDEGVEHFLHNVWDSLSTGVHMASDHGTGRGKSPAFSGPGNMGKKASAERVLHWKDADAWRQYQERFGDPVIERGVIASLMRAGTDTALMRKWGTNPVFAHDNLLRTIQEKYRDDHEAMAEFQKALPRLRREFEFLTGTQDRPGHTLSDRILSPIYAWQDIEHLNHVLFTHLSVGATMPHQLRFLGVGRWRAYTAAVRNLVQDKSPQGRAVMQGLAANAEGQAREIMSGYEPMDSVPGRIAKLRTLVMRLGGLPAALARERMGAQWEISHVFGGHLGKPIDALPPRMQRALRLYGLNGADWDALRGAPDHEVSGSGATHLTPQAAYRASDAAIEALDPGRIANAATPESATRIRDDIRAHLSMKLASLYTDSADRAVVTPGVPERALLRTDTWLGKIVGQYKSWGAAAVRQMWGQSLYGTTKADAVKALAALSATSAAMGYLRTVVTDALVGKVPQQFTIAQQFYMGKDAPPVDLIHDALLLGSSLIKGSGLGILGDMLLGQMLEVSTGSAYERSLKYIAQLAGPVVGDAARVGGLVTEYVQAGLQKHPQKAFRNSNADLLRFVEGLVPFINAWYARLMTNWLIFNRLQEAASPGYLERYQRRVKKESGQNFWLPPTHYLGHP